MAQLLYGDLTGEIIGAAIEVHNILGPGLAESVYETALVHELGLRGIKVVRQAKFLVPYKDIIAGELFVDVLVPDKVLVELKATSEHNRVFEKQVLYYLKATHVKVGLLLNFGMDSLYKKRFVGKAALEADA